MSHALSKVRIGNMALSHIGTDSTIESFTETSAEAKEVELWYDYSRLQTLASYDWSFARKRLTLATHSDDPPDGVWAYRYQYPSDCTKFRKIQNPTGSPLVTFQADTDVSNAEDAIPFDVEISPSLGTKSILTDLNEAVGVYTFDQEAPELFSPFFVEMLSRALATHLCYALTGNIELKKQITLEFAQMSRLAPSMDANEQVERPPRDSDWIRGR
jgi:hypothetical protein